jgi:hypothetical protein
MRREKQGTHSPHLAQMRQANPQRPASPEVKKEPAGHGVCQQTQGYWPHLGQSIARAPPAICRRTCASSSVIDPSAGTVRFSGVPSPLTECEVRIAVAFMVRVIVA